ncbi:MAG: efflux RND transporter periplasmic adaptor subunit [Betaproteobacteria bacterium]
MMARFSRAGAAIAGLALMAFAAGCGGEKKAAGPPPAVPVRAALTTREDVPFEWRGVGTVEAINTVSVKAQVGGELVRVHFREGDEVRKGDPLFTLDERPFQAALREAQAQLERDRALAENAAADARRYTELVAKDSVTRSDADERTSRAASQKATVQADEAAVERARLNLQYCRITAPMSGRTGSLMVKVGNIVKANDDKPMVVIQQIEPILVAFALPQQHLGQVRQRMQQAVMPAEASAPDDKTPPHAGRLVFIDNAVDTATGTIALKAEFPNQDRALWPGEFVNVALTLGVDQGAVVAPSQAVQSSQAGDFVFVIKDDQTVDMRPVTVERTAGERAVIAKGLEPGERVVVDGQLRLAPGTRVEVLADQGKAAAAS